jgi:N-acetylglucosamine-6-phosphate deacetylase
MFFDIQINGCWGVDFNSESLTPQEWRFAQEKLSLDGTEYYLPTIITDSIDAMVAKLNRLAAFIEEEPTSNRRARGIHIEGPFISSEPGYIGAHPVKHAQKATLDAAKSLLEAGNGLVKLVTLAPEQDPRGEVTRYLSSQGVCVAAGHTNATREQLQEAIDNGLQVFTHLGNGCPAILPRHDNIVHRVLSLHDKLRVSLIADGHHLPLWLLRSWIDWFGIERVSIVSDAISAAGLSQGMHTLGNRKVLVGEDGVPRSEDRTHFVGSGTTLGRMNQILESELHLNASERQQLLRTNSERLIFGQDLLMGPDKNEPDNTQA